jgi:hypothetical protein
LVITIVKDHDLLCFVDEQARVRLRILETKLVHSFAQMLIEELGGIHLTVDALV